LTAFDERKFDTETLTNGKANLELARASEIYRFFWLRSFHRPVVIKVYELNGERYINLKLTDGKSASEPGLLVTNATRKLSNVEWCEFVALLDSSDFWKMDKMDVSRLANDGSFWILEGVRASEKGRRYYIAGEQSPVGGDFYRACLELMKLAGLNIDVDDPSFY
jgi:hypothetical protein